MEKIVCPKCEKDDQIQKVTSIYTGGVSTSFHELHGAFYNSATSTSQTALSIRLSPPAKPKSRSDALNELAHTSLLIKMIVGFINLAFFIGWGIYELIPSIAENFKSLAFISIAVSFVVIVLLAVVSFPPAKADSNWKRMMATKYNELYYCYRDDCVFDPRTNKYTSPEGMNRLLD